MVTIKFLGGREVKRKQTKKCMGIRNCLYCLFSYTPDQILPVSYLDNLELQMISWSGVWGVYCTAWPGTDRRLYQLWSWWWPEITGGERVLRYSSNLCPSCCLQQKMISTRGKVQGAVCIACYGCGAECVSHVRIICGWRYYFMTSSVKPLKHYGKKLGVNISSCSEILQ